MTWKSLSIRRRCPKCDGVGRRAPQQDSTIEQPRNEWPKCDNCTDGIIEDIPDSLSKSYADLITAQSIHLCTDTMELTSNDSLNPETAIPSASTRNVDSRDLIEITDIQYNYKRPDTSLSITFEGEIDGWFFDERIRENPMTYDTRVFMWLLRVVNVAGIQLDCRFRGKLVDMSVEKSKNPEFVKAICTIHVLDKNPLLSALNAPMLESARPSPDGMEIILRFTSSIRAQSIPASAIILPKGVKFVSTNPVEVNEREVALKLSIGLKNESSYTITVGDGIVDTTGRSIGYAQSQTFTYQP